MVLIILSRVVCGRSPFPRDLPPRGVDFCYLASSCIIVTMEGEAALRLGLRVFIFWTGWMEIIPPGIVNIFVFWRWVTASISECKRERAEEEETDVCVTL